MLSVFKEFARRLTPGKIARIYEDPVRRIYENEISKGRISYSQEGEDLILDRCFSGKSNGFYVDIGAHHPWRFSNTYLFYKKGWTGINIDPRPGIMRLFDAERPGDINLSVAVGQRDEYKDFYVFNEPALSTFSKEEANRNDGVDGYRIIQTIPVRTRRLADILDESLPARVIIDFVSIDVEGMDMEVALSNNWAKYCPEFVLIECLRTSIENVRLSEACSFFDSVGYEFFAKCVNTVFFKRRPTPLI